MMLIYLCTLINITTIQVMGAKEEPGDREEVEEWVVWEEAAIVGQRVQEIPTEIPELPITAIQEGSQVLAVIIIKKNQNSISL